MSRPSAGYCRVSPRFWAQAQEEEWTDDMVILGLYLLTCEHRTTEGIFRLPLEYMAADLPEGWVTERVRVTLAALVSKGFVKYDEKARVVFLPKAMKYQRPDNRNQQIAALKNVMELPETPLLQDFVSAANQYCPAFANVLAAQGLPQGLPGPLPEGLPQGIPDPPTPTPTPTPTLKPSMSSHSEPKSADSTDLVIADEDVSIVSEGDSGFDEFWAAYPRREGKKAALKAWTRTPKRDRAFAIQVAALMAQLVAAGCREPRFVPLPATFLNGRRYDDWRDGVPASWQPEGVSRQRSSDAVVAMALANLEDGP